MQHIHLKLKSFLLNQKYNKYLLSELKLCSKSAGTIRHFAEQGFRHFGHHHRFIVRVLCNIEHLFADTSNRIDKYYNCLYNAQ